MALKKCNVCKNDIGEDANNCPNCGNVINKKTLIPVENVSRTNGLCLAGLIIALTSFVIDFLGLVSITALILSIIGLNAVKNDENSKKNRNYAMAGIVCASIEILYKIIQIISLY